MSSARDKLKKMNLNQSQITTSEHDNLTKEIKRVYEEASEEKKESEQIAPQQDKEQLEKPEQVVKPILESAEVIKSLSKGGRPKKYNQELKKLTVYLPEDDYTFLKMHCGIYDGMNGYIIHLIKHEKDRMKREEK